MSGAAIESEALHPSVDRGRGGARGNSPDPLVGHSFFHGCVQIRCSAVARPPICHTGLRFALSIQKSMVASVAAFEFGKSLAQYMSVKGFFRPLARAEGPPARPPQTGGSKVKYWWSLRGSGRRRPERWMEGKIESFCLMFLKSTSRHARGQKKRSKAVNH